MALRINRNRLREIRRGKGLSAVDMNVLWVPGSKPFQVREVREHRGYQGRPLGVVADRMKAESKIITHKM